GAAALLLLAAAVVLTAAWQPAAGRQAGGLALAAGLLTVAAVGGTVRPVLPSVWTVPAYLACGMALLAVARPARLPQSVRQGLVHASAVVQGLALLWTLPPVALALTGPVSWIERVWSGAPATVRTAVTADAPWPPHTGTAPLVLAAVAGVLFLTRDAVGRTRALTGVLVLGWATALVLPAVLDVPYTVGLVALGCTTAGALAAAIWIRTPERPEPLRLTATILALLTTLPLVLLSLADESATLAVTAALTALFAAASWTPRLAPVTAPAALGYATALACASGAAAGWRAQDTAVLVLVVPVVAALLAARLGDGARATVPVEVTGALAALLAFALAAASGDLPMLALVLALCAVIVSATALRPGRRPLAFAGTALFVLAAWVRLAAWDVGTPEAYTLPVTVPALAVGFLSRRRDTGVSSWTAYGPGLAATLVPSLLAAWGDPHWARPLLLGLAALAVTLLGARHHLQAPLLLGGTVLALDALHELAPYIVQVTDALPRWVPPALAGLLLLAVGATYEQRLRDARRVRDFLGTMR
ncbi:SCO7613 C-terminal domain-containing membrane protein, partial [Streptomyces nigra]